MKEPASMMRQVFKAPRAAGVAGILFAVLFSTGMVLIRLTIPEEISGPNSATWVPGNTAPIALALTLMPFAGLCFLWFMAVVRDHLGASEDQFFSTVFLGSGLLFLAMMFTSAAVAQGILVSVAIAANTFIKSGGMLFERSLMYTITNTYAVRMAAVFMMALATIWMRTGVMPRVLVFPTYALAILLLVSSNLTLWLVLIFPAWVLIISIRILVVNLHNKPIEAKGVSGSNGV